MEVNFLPCSSVEQHLMSVIGNDSLILLAGEENDGFQKAKVALIYFLTKEFLRIHDKSCLIITTPTSQAVEQNELEILVETLSNLTFGRNTSDELDVPGKKTNPRILIHTIDEINGMISQKTLLADVSLLLVDSPSLRLDEELLMQIKCISDASKLYGIRVAVITGSDYFLSSIENVQGSLNDISRYLELHVSVDTDCVLIGNNGNLVGLHYVAYDEEDSSVDSDSLEDQISKHLMATVEFLIAYQTTNSYSEEQKCCIDLMRDLMVLYEDFGLLALCEGIKVADKKLEELVDTMLNPTTVLILKYMRSQLQIIDMLVAERTDFECHYEEDVFFIEIIKPSMRILLDYIDSQLLSLNFNCLEDLEHIRMKSFPAKRSFCIVTDTCIIAKSVYNSLLYLQSYNTTLQQFKIVYLKKDSTYKQSLDKMVLCVATKHCEREQFRKLNCRIAVMFNVPWDHNEFLTETRWICKAVNKIVYIVPDDDLESLDRLQRFRELMALLASKMPAYVNPTEAQQALQQRDHQLESVCIDSKLELTPERSIEVVRNYSKFLILGNKTASVGVSGESQSNDEACRGTTCTQTRTILHFPVNSMLLRSVYGPWVTYDATQPCSTTHSLVTSRMAASMEVCKLLYNAGELSEALEPGRIVKGKENAIQEELLKDVIGLSQKKLFHQQIPRLLIGSFPKLGQSSCLYVIKTQVSNAWGDEVFDRYLGFYSTKRLPQIPRFLICCRGTQKVLKISEVSKTCVLEAKLLEKLSMFSNYVITHVLGYDIPVDCERPQLDNGFLWTVLKASHNTYVIDEKFLESNDFPRTGYAVDQLRTMDFDTLKSAHDSVIIPTHRSEHRNTYYVDDIDEDLSVDDPFPDQKVADTYVNFFRNKYNIQLSPGQPMLEIYPSHRNLNFLNQKCRDQKYGSKQRQNCLMPMQLCAGHPIKRHLWEQILVVPVLLHRVSCVLLLEEFRAELLKDIVIGNQPGELDLTCNEDKQIIGIGSPISFLVDFSSNGELHYEARSTHLTSNTISNDAESSRVVAKYNHKSVTDIINEEAMSRNGTNAPVGSPCSTLKASPKQQFGNDSMAGDTNKVPSLYALLAAFTTANANDFFHHEKLEFLGDSIINAFVSVELFYHNNCESENVLAKKKHSLVSNVALFEKGQRLGLWNYVVDEQFDFKLSPMILALLGCVQCETCAQKDGCQSNVEDVRINGGYESNAANSMEMMTSDSFSMAEPDYQDTQACLFDESYSDIHIFPPDPSTHREPIRVKAAAVSGDISSRNDNFMDSHSNTVKYGNMLQPHARGKSSHQSSHQTTKQISSPDRQQILSPGRPTLLLRGQTSSSDGQHSSGDKHEILDEDNITIEGVVNYRDSISTVTLTNRVEDRKKSKNPSSKICGRSPDISSLEQCISCYGKSIRKKAIADSVEALVGLFYLCNGEEITLKLMKRLGFDVCCIPSKTDKMDRLHPSSSLSDALDAMDVSSDQDGNILCEPGLCQAGSKQINLEASLRQKLVKPAEKSCLKDGIVKNKQCLPGLPLSYVDGAFLENDALLSDAEEGWSDIAEGNFQENISESHYSKEESSGKYQNLHNRAKGDFQEKLTEFGFQEKPAGSDNTEEGSNGKFSNIECNFKEKSFGTNNTEGGSKSAEAFTALSHRIERTISKYTLKELGRFESKIGYTFKKKEILYEALLHPSYPRQLACDTYCNQRMEFLGDSLLTLLVTRHLCGLYPTANNDRLTSMRKIIISSRTFATVAALHDYHKYLMFISTEFASSLQSFVREVEEKSCCGRVWPLLSTEELSLYHDPEYRRKQQLIVDVPKDLDDVFESVAAAVFIDCEDLEVLWQVYHPMLRGVIDSLPPP